MPKHYVVASAHSDALLRTLEAYILRTAHDHAVGSVR
jgi:hypothetical protein